MINLLTFLTDHEFIFNIFIRMLIISDYKIIIYIIFTLKELNEVMFKFNTIILD